MPTINAASTPSRNVTTRAENIGLRFDYENEIQFHFQLEIVPSRQVDSQQIENAAVPKWEIVWRRRKNRLPLSGAKFLP
jgi:hypothetical protein